MGKKQNVKSKSEDSIEVDNQAVETKSLDKYLPHTKFIKKRINALRKNRTIAIKQVNLDKFQIKKAIQALVKFAQQNQNPADLFGEEGFIYLEVDTTRVPEDYSIRPVQIKLPTPIYSKQLNSRFTIFSCDPEADFTDKIDSLDIPMIREVIGYQKTKKNFKQLKDKRALLAANDLFFCDWRIYNLLRQPLGKLFYEKKKYPYPIECNGEVPEELKEQYATYEEYLQGLGNYTYFMMGNGPAYAIKVGRTKMDVKELVKNVMHGAYGLISHILGSDSKLLPEHIRQISIKTYNSPSLPIYNYLSQQQIKSYTKTTKASKKNK